MLSKTQSFQTKLVPRTKTHQDPSIKTCSNKLNILFFHLKMFSSKRGTRTPRPITMNTPYGSRQYSDASRIASRSQFVQQALEGEQMYQTRINPRSPINIDIPIQFAKPELLDRMYKSYINGEVELSEIEDSELLELANLADFLADDQALTEIIGEILVQRDHNYQQLYEMMDYEPAWLSKVRFYVLEYLKLHGAPRNKTLVRLGITQEEAESCGISNVILPKRDLSNMTYTPILTIGFTSKDRYGVPWSIDDLEEYRDLIVDFYQPGDTIEYTFGSKSYSVVPEDNTLGAFIDAVKPIDEIYKGLRRTTLGGSTLAEAFRGLGRNAGLVTFSVIDPKGNIRM